MPDFIKNPRHIQKTAIQELDMHQRLYKYYGHTKQLIYTEIIGSKTRLMG